MFITNINKSDKPLSKPSKKKRRNPRTSIWNEKTTIHTEHRVTTAVRKYHKLDTVDEMD